jgi:threonine/homoserine/homoserine lactone efflux protein
VLQPCFPFGFFLMFVMTPGADWAYAITAGIRGRQVPAVTGLVFGYVVLTIVVAAGIGPLVAGNTAAMALLTVMGALYLAWLGIGMLRHPPAPIAVGEEVGQISWRSAAMKGALVSGLNPKAFMFFLAFLLPLPSQTPPGRSRLSFSRSEWSIPSAVLSSICSWVMAQASYSAPDRRQPVLLVGCQGSLCYYSVPSFYIVNFHIIKLTVEMNANGSLLTGTI